MEVASSLAEPEHWEPAEGLPGEERVQCIWRELLRVPQQGTPEYRTAPMDQISHLPSVVLSVSSFLASPHRKRSVHLDITL